MPTAAAKRAEEADKQRMQNNTTEAEKAARREYMRKYRQEHAEELNEKRRKKYAESIAAEEDTVSLDTSPFPCDSIIAAAVGQKHNLSVIEAEGRTINGNRVVLVEHVYVDGVRYHRVKRTEYSYHRSRKAAIAAAQKENLKLIIYGGSKK